MTFLFTLFLALAPLIGHAANLSCPEMYEGLDISGPLVKSRVLNPAAMSEQGHFPLRDQTGYNPKSLLIGLESHPERGSVPHYYLVAGKRRLEGDVLFIKPKVLTSSLGTKGVGFELDVPPGVAEAVETRLKNNGAKRGLSCLHVLCEVLREEGIEIEGAEKGKPIRTKVVSASLIQGKIKLHGQMLDPALVRMFESHEGELAEFFRQAHAGDRKVRNQILGNLGVTTGMLILVPGMIGVMIFSHSSGK